MNFDTFTFISFLVESAYTLTTPWDYRTQQPIFCDLSEYYIKFDIDDIGICNETLIMKHATMMEKNVFF